MKIKLIEDFEYSPDGVVIKKAKKGEILDGELATWAMAQNKGERIAEKAVKKPPQKKVKKAPATKAKTK